MYGVCEIGGPVKKFRTFRVIVTVAFCALGVLGAGAHAQSLGKDKFIALGTSSKSGVYYPVGAEICNLLNEGRDKHLVRCLAYETGGSIYNIQALRSGELDVAITRADLAYLAAKGEGIFKQVGPMPGLRIISSLYENPLGIIVKADSNVTAVEELVGSRINIGNLGSGKRDFADMLFKSMNWSASDFQTVTEYSTSKMGRAFCDGEVDVLIQVMGIPASFYDKMINECGGKFLEVSDDIFSRLKAEAPFIERNIIPGGMYSSNPGAVKTVGAKAVLITMDRVSGQTIEKMTSALLGNLEHIKANQPAMSGASVESMVNEGVYVPFHSGAESYFQKQNINYSNIGDGQ